MRAALFFRVPVTFNVPSACTVSELPVLMLKPVLPAATVNCAPGRTTIPPLVKVGVTVLLNSTELPLSPLLPIEIVGADASVNPATVTTLPLPLTVQAVLHVNDVNVMDPVLAVPTTAPIVPDVTLAVVTVLVDGVKN